MNMEKVGRSYAGAPVITKFVSLSCRKKELTNVLRYGSCIRSFTSILDSHYKNFKESNNQYSLQIPIF